MKLYHGSDVDIDTVDISLCTPLKDFGQGFYLTEDKAHAQRMAERRADFSGKTAVVNEYDFDERLLTDVNLKVKIFNEYSVEWAEFVNRNRRGEETDRFDIVYGPIADDKVGVQIRLFTEGYISIEEFLERIKFYRGITFQYFFGTPKAVSHLKKVRK